MSLYYKENPVYFKSSLDSIFQNSVQPDQVVLVLDGPVGDELSKIVEEYKSKYPALDVYPQDVNRGLSMALNIGLEKCRNEIVFRMDTDDKCYPIRFERILKEYENDPSLELVGSFATMIDENDRIIKGMSTPESQNDIYKKVSPIQ